MKLDTLIAISIFIYQQHHRPSKFIAINLYLLRFEGCVGHGGGGVDNTKSHKATIITQHVTGYLLTSHKYYSLIYREIEN